MSKNPKSKALNSKQIQIQNHNIKTYFAFF